MDMKERLKFKFKSLMALPNFEFSKEEVSRLEELIFACLERESEADFINLEKSIDVAFILSEEVNLGKVSILGLMLHTLITLNAFPDNEIEASFGIQVASIVKGLQKASELNSKEQSYESENFRKLLLTLVEDIRVVIILICNQLYEMRQLSIYEEDTRMKLAKESSFLYAPLAHRLGMNGLKSELENLCLFYLNPQEFKIVDELIDQKNEYKNFDINGIIKKVSSILDEHKLPYRIFGRTKHIYSVYKKMYVKHNPFEKIFDLQAIRIITNTKLQCYEILGLIHTFYKPIPGRFKDYIAMPKTNMYQSLHTTVLDEDGELFEIQIRTEEMDYVAERGIAAHWIYKENNNENKTQELSDTQLSWLKDLIKITEESSDASDVEYMKQVQKDLFETSIYVLTPKGKIIDMPTGSTPVDFAYRVHTQVGNTCVGALVNKVMVPLETELQSGDIVEIKTSKNSIGASERWLDFVKTSLAKTQIKKSLQKRMLPEDNTDRIELLYQKGVRMFDDYCKERFVDKEDAHKQIELPNNLKYFDVNNVYDLFVLIGQKTISAASIISKLFEQSSSIEDQIEVLNKKSYTVKKTKIKDTIILSGNAQGIKVETAVCCKPIPGDPIVGFITRGSGIKIHRIDCPNVNKEKERLIEAFWNDNIEKGIYPVDLEIISYDRHNLVVDLMGLISTLNIRIDSLSAKSHYKTKTATLSCTVYVSDFHSLTVLIGKIKAITGVVDVNRVSH